MVVGELPRSDSDTANEYVRDEDYYFEDGSMVILAENRLFKVRKLQPVIRCISLRTSLLRYIGHYSNGTLHSSNHFCPFLKAANNNLQKVNQMNILSSVPIQPRISVHYVGWCIPGSFFFRGLPAIPTKSHELDPLMFSRSKIGAQWTSQSSSALWESPINMISLPLAHGLGMFFIIPIQRTLSASFKNAVHGLLSAGFSSSLLNVGKRLGLINWRILGLIKFPPLTRVSPPSKRVWTSRKTPMFSEIFMPNVIMRIFNQVVLLQHRRLTIASPQSIWIKQDHTSVTLYQT